MANRYGLALNASMFIVIVKCACIWLVQLVKLTLNLDSSVLEIESALAIMGMMLTLVSSFFMQTKSIDFNLEQKHYSTL